MFTLVELVLTLDEVNCFILDSVYIGFEAEDLVNFDNASYGVLALFVFYFFSVSLTLIPSHIIANSKSFKASTTICPSILQDIYKQISQPNICFSS